MTSRRSPNYPQIDLAVAVQLATQIYTQEKRGSFPMESIAAAWGYSSVKTSNFRIRLGALRQYGLLTKGTKESQLTDCAVVLNIRTPATRDYQEALREAALSPDLFREIYETRREGSDETLKQHLMFAKNFTDEGAARCIKAYRGTMNMVDWGADDIMSGQSNEDVVEEHEEIPVIAPTTNNAGVAQQGAITISLPFSTERQITVTLPVDIKLPEWNLLIETLKFYEPDKPESDHSRSASEP